MTMSKINVNTVALCGILPKEKLKAYFNRSGEFQRISLEQFLGGVSHLKI